MESLKTVKRTLFVSAGFVAIFAACQQNIVDKPETTSVTTNQVEELVRLGEKKNPSPEETARFNASYQQLSFDELVQYRQGQYVDIRKQYGNTESVNQALQADLAWWKQVNRTSIAKFGRTSNKINAEELNQLFETLDKESASANARIAQAACPTISFNTSFTRGTGGSTRLNATRASEVNTGDGDCDCQLTFATSNTNFRRLVPLTTTAGTLLNDFGGGLGGRQLTGASAGTYPVWGKTRVTFRYPNQVFQGCNVLLNQYQLSNQ